MNVAIVGSGIVGQATGKGLFMKGNNVTFYDINEEKLKHLRDEGYTATNNLDDTLQNSEVIFVSVPTPTIQGHIELKYIKDVTRKIAKALKKTKKYTVVTYRSTIPPQTTRTKLIPLLEKNSNLIDGKKLWSMHEPRIPTRKKPSGRLSKSKQSGYRVF